MRDYNIQRGATLLLALALCIFLTSCEIFKPARDSKKDKVYKDDKGELGDIQGRRVYNPETGEYEVVRVVTGKLDTVSWVELPANKFPPITSDGSFDGGGAPPINSGTTTTTAEGSVLKPSYNVAVLLPFLTHQYNESGTTLPKNSQWAVSFYSGMKMAMPKLESEGVNLDIRVIDSRGDESETQKLLRSNPDLNNADLIIGPYRRKNVRAVAEFARQKDITFVSPYSASTKISERNPNYIQVNPSLMSHCEAIVKHVKDNYKSEEVVLVARDENDEKAWLEVIQRANIKFADPNDLSDTSSLKEYVISDESADYRDMDILPYIREGGKTTVFIVPSYRSENFVYSLFRQLAVNKSVDDRIVVYGFQPWMNYDRIDFDLFENLNVHVSSGSYVDSFDPDVQLFQRRYYNDYGMPPEPEVLMGHDIMLYFGRMLKKYGTKFQLSLESETPLPYLQTKFDIERVINNPNMINDNLNRIDQWENKFIHILKFQNYHYQPVDN
ncbi:MAG: ABC transporter substrate-binding protein [Bacteroidetes bacterium]|jgi:hypothetical protein|nr:ABC transporter substrate-binding protein [Bacteroidota bacterium]